MKIGFFTDYYLPKIDGVSVSVEMFRKALEKQGHTVYVFCPKYPNPPKNEPTSIIRFTSTPGIWYEGYRDTFPWTPKNIRLIRSLNLDIIHIHAGGQLSTLGSHIAYKENIPLVYSYHTDVVYYSKVYKSVPFGAAALLLIGKLGTKDMISYRDYFSIFKPEESKEIKWSQKIVKDTIKITCNNCDLVIVPSVKVSQMLSSYGVHTHTEIIPTGLDLEEMRHHGKIPAELAKQLTNTGPILLAVGRMGKEKNFQLIIRTLPRLIKKYPDIKLVLAGGGPYQEELTRLAIEHGLASNVIFTGWLDHLVVLDIYKYADIFVFPSQTDTQGLVLNEAAYFNLPIIYSDHSISEAVNDGKNGYYASPNITSLAAKIDLLLSNKSLWDELSQGSRKLADKLDISIQAKRLEEAYNKLLK